MVLPDAADDGYIHRYTAITTDTQMWYLMDTMISWCTTTWDGGTDDTTRYCIIQIHIQIQIHCTRYHHRHLDVVYHGWHDICILYRTYGYLYTILSGMDTQIHTTRCRHTQIPPQTPGCGISWMLWYHGVRDLRWWIDDTTRCAALLTGYGYHQIWAPIHTYQIHSYHHRYTDVVSMDGMISRCTWPEMVG